MRGINKVTILGTLGADPEVRYTKDGTAIATMSLATNERWKDKDGNPQERTEWHRVKFFGRTAEVAGEYLTKGKSVYIEGKLRTEKYTDKEGIERYSTDIIGSEMQLLSKPERSEGGNRAAAPSRQAGNAPAPSNLPPPAASQFEDDDIPF